MVIEAAPPALVEAAAPAPAIGTPEEAWACSPMIGNLPPLDLSACRRALVLAPHPHDETLALGGTIAMLSAMGVPVTVVFATDGEPSQPGGRGDRASKGALSALCHGCSGPLRAVRLHVDRGGLARAERNAATLLTGLLRRGDWCFAPWEKDGETDHDSGGRIAQEAARRAHAWPLSYPLTTWHRFAPDDPTPPWDRACQVPLTAQALLRKGRAMSCYESPADGELAHFTRTYEVVYA